MHALRPSRRSEFGIIGDLSRVCFCVTGNDTVLTEYVLH